MNQRSAIAHSGKHRDVWLYVNPDAQGVSQRLARVLWTRAEERKPEMTYPMSA